MNSGAEEARKKAAKSRTPPAVYCKHCEEFYSPVPGIKEKHEKKKCRPVRRLNRK